MDFEQLNSKSIALLIWNTEKEDDAHIYIGEIIKEGVDRYFVNKAKGWKLLLDEEKLDRFKKVTEEMKEIFLGADYVISLTMASLPNDNNNDFLLTGLKWH